MPRISATPSVSSINAAPGGTAAVDRALSVLFAFKAGQGELTLSELASLTQLHKSTVLRLLASLQHYDLVTRTSTGYRLSTGVLRLHAAYSASSTLEDALMPILQALVYKTGESAAYHVRQGDTRLCLFRVDSPHPLRDHIRPGDVLPLTQGAGGHVLLAYEDETHPAHEELLKVGAIVKHGDRVQGLSGISAPVVNAQGKLLGAITLTMPTERMKESFIAEVHQAAVEACRRLGNA
jgi:DNA-binding IclR family transcriptional regulator